MHTLFASNTESSTTRPRSTSGVESLIAQACQRHEASLLAQAVSPLFPEDCPWQRVAEVPKDRAPRIQHHLTAITAAIEDYRNGLTSAAGYLGSWLDASEEDIQTMAWQFAKLDLTTLPRLDEPGTREALLTVPSVTGFPGMVDFLSHPVLPKSAFARKLLWAEGLLRTRIPGDTPAAQLSRLADPKFWRRAIRVIIMREREYFFLRVRLVGKQAESYVSDLQLANRKRQLKLQAEWMANTVLVPRELDPDKKTKRLLTLAEVASSPSTRFAKLYTFVNAMDAIAVEQNLAMGMLTLTLEPEWHPNPSHGVNSWNGASPREAHQSLCRRWQAVLRDLDRLAIGVSGLRVVEPHKDACPHWHIWLLYKPEAEQRILETVMRYFPNKLKVRGLVAKAHRIYDTLEDLKADVGRAPKYAKEGAQVELARIDRSISSGASYAMKYLLKTVNASAELNASVGLFPKEGVTLPAKAQEAVEAKRKKHEMTAQRVDAYRSLWGINAAQLFGVAKCLTAWDELRLLDYPPADPRLKKLWALARGGKKEGPIRAGSGIRGDAKGFIAALGGLAACGKAAAGEERISIGRLTDSSVNSYGEEITRTKGVTLVSRKREKVVVRTRVQASTGEIKPVWGVRSVRTVLAGVVTRLKEWTLAPAKSAPFALELLQKRMNRRGSWPKASTAAKVAPDPFMATGAS